MFQRWKALRRLTPALGATALLLGCPSPQSGSDAGPGGSSDGGPGVGRDGGGGNPWGGDGGCAALVDTLLGGGQGPDGGTLGSSEVFNIEVFDCHGNGVPGLAASDFSLTEDGVPVQPTLVKSARSTSEVALLIDLTSRGTQYLPDEVAAAKAFIQEAQSATPPAVHVNLYLFGGAQGFTPVPGLDLDTPGLLAALDSLSADAGSSSPRDLYGAIDGALQAMTPAEQALEGRNLSGTLADLSVVVITAGPDAAATDTPTNVQALECVPGATYCHPASYGTTPVVCTGGNCTGNLCPDGRICNPGQCLSTGTDYACFPNTAVQCGGAAYCDQSGFPYACSGTTQCCCTSAACQKEWAFTYCQRQRRVYAIAMPVPGLDPSSIAPVAPSGIETPTDSASAAASGTRLADEVIANRTAIYEVGYCSALRAGSHTAAVSIKGVARQDPITRTFNADTFQDGCTPGLLASADACGSRDCGGLWCGACDDRTSTCLAGAGCVDDCVAADAGLCGQTLTNPLGYAVSCASVPPWTQCGASCVNVLEDTNHCGGCGTSCVTSGAFCDAGTCGCPAGQGPCETMEKLADASGAVTIALDDASVYWGEEPGTGASYIRRVSKAGGPVELLVDGGSSPEIRGRTLYYWDGLARAIQSVPVDGGPTTTILQRPASGVVAFTLDDANLYAFAYTNAAAQTYALSMVPLDGGSPVTIDQGTQTVPGEFQIAVGGTDVYWIAPTALMDAPIAGGGSYAIDNNTNALGVTADPAGAYFTDSYFATGNTVNIWRRGSPPRTLTQPNYLGAPIVTDGDNVYWYSSPTKRMNLMKAPFDGGAPVALGSITLQPEGLAVDATSVYWVDYSQYTHGVYKLTPK